MLFLLRPRQAWMPYARPRDTTSPANEVPAAPEPRRVDDVGSLRQLAELHRAGKLTDDEFTAAKRRVIAQD